MRKYLTPNFLVTVVLLLVMSYLLAQSSGFAETKQVPITADPPSRAYSLKIEKIYDADTITVDIDLGFGVILDDQKIRFYRINAWEIRGADKEKGLAAKVRLQEMLLNKKVYLMPVKFKTKSGFKKGKYGRWLGEIYVDGVNINDKLVKEGHAKYQDY